jgi:hypothetical protein
VDLGSLPDKDLAELQTRDNIWYATHARRILQERSQAHGADAGVVKQLLGIIENDKVVTHQLRALWALEATGSLEDGTGLTLLQSPNEYLRAWTIQGLCESAQPSEAVVQALTKMAREDTSPVVRLYLASGAQRIPLSQRAPLVEALVAHAEDSGDANLPFMYWYAAEPLVGQKSSEGVALLTKSKIPKLREWITRRMAAGVKAAAK